MKRRAEDEARRAGPWPPLERAQLAAAAEALSQSYPQVEVVYLFGSRARAGTHPGSDVDLAVLTEPGVAPAWRVETAAEWARFLEGRLSVPVDVVLLHRDLPPGLLFDIFSVETILFARDVARAHRVACQARNEYRDLLPRLERGFDRVQSRIKEWARAADRS